MVLDLPLRGDTKQEDVAGLVFGELCKAEGGAVTVRQSISDRGEEISKPVCEPAARAPAAPEPGVSDVVGPGRPVLVFKLGHVHPFSMEKSLSCGTP